MTQHGVRPTSQDESHLLVLLGQEQLESGTRSDKIDQSLMLASPLPGWQELRSFGTVLKRATNQSSRFFVRVILKTYLGSINDTRQRYLLA
jgi:hypothetical protein